METDLEFSVGRLVLAERTLGKSAPEIIAEVGAEGGASVTTLRGLVAAGMASPGEVALGLVLAPTLRRAEARIERDGLAVTARALGDVLGVFLESIGHKSAMPSIYEHPDFDSEWVILR